MSDMARGPDPTALTTQQLWREISSLKELLTARIDSIEKAISIAHEDMVRVPTEVQKQVGNLRELHDEKFTAVQILIDEKFGNVYQRFEERDVRTEQVSRDSKLAIDAALQAAKELGDEHNKFSSMAISKNEASTYRQLEQLDSKIVDLKDRLTRIEGMDLGADKASAMKNISNSFTVMVIGIVISGILGATGIVISILR